jgi:DNA-binding beta-propeller fold protein YncE
MSAVRGLPRPGGTSPVSLTVAPTGKFAYAANFNSNDVSVYTINPATVALTDGLNKSGFP